MTGRKYAVIGLGQFGSAIARYLSKRGAEVIAIDSREEKVDDIKDDVAMAIVMDATDKKALLSQGVQDADAVIVAIGENFEALLLCTVQLMEMNVKRIISRANGAQQRMILEKMGVKEILSPEDEVAIVVAEKILDPNIISFLQLPDDYEIAELKAPKGIVNRTVGDIDLRNKYRLNLVTIKREYEESKEGKVVAEKHVIGVPSSQTVIYDTDTIVVFGTSKDIERFLEIN